MASHRGNKVKEHARLALGEEKHHLLMQEKIILSLGTVPAVRE